MLACLALSLAPSLAPPLLDGAIPWDALPHMVSGVRRLSRAPPSSPLASFALISSPLTRHCNSSPGAALLLWTATHRFRGACARERARSFVVATVLMSCEEMNPMQGKRGWWRGVSER